MTKRYWPGQNIIGRRLRLPRLVAPPPTAGVGLGLPKGSESVEIIGVVRDGKFGLSEEHQPTMYRPVTQVFQPALSLHTRSAGDPKALISALRREARALDEHLAFFNIRTLEEQKVRSIFVQRAIATLLTALGLVGLGLAALGLYGVIAFSVRQRTGEIGVRMALGAQRCDVLSMVLSQGLKLALVGVALGLAGAFVFTRLLRGLLFEVSPNDPLILVSIALLLIVVSMLATWLPARRATQISPIEALRYE
jgi:putative ABC transport system permease protein